MTNDRSTMTINVDIHKNYRIFCIVKGIKMSRMTDLAISEFMEKYKDVERREIAKKRPVVVEINPQMTEDLDPPEERKERHEKNEREWRQLRGEIDDDGNKIEEL